MEDTIFVNTKVPPELDAALRGIAAKYHVSRSDVVRWAMEAYVKRVAAVDREDGAHAPTDAD